MKVLLCAYALLQPMFMLIIINKKARLLLSEDESQSRVTTSFRLCLTAHASAGTPESSTFNTCGQHSIQYPTAVTGSPVVTLVKIPRYAAPEPYSTHPCHPFSANRALCTAINNESTLSFIAFIGNIQLIISIPVSVKTVNHLK